MESATPVASSGGVYLVKTGSMALFGFEELCVIPVKGVYYNHILWGEKMYIIIYVNLPLLV